MQVNALALRIVVGWIALHALIVGCASPPIHIVLPVPRTDSQLTTLLDFFQNAKSLKEDDLLALYHEEEEVFFYQEEPHSLVRLAILHTLSNTPLQNTEQARTLLERYLDLETSQRDLKDFATLLHYVLSERQWRETLYTMTKQRLDATMADREQRDRRYQELEEQLSALQDEQRQHETRNKQLGRQLREEKLAAENLRKQIEQLKSIEKTLTKRKQEAPST